MKMYIVKEASTITELEDRVDGAMQAGYIPHGNMVIEAHPDLPIYYYQPMVKT